MPNAVKTNPGLHERVREIYHREVAQEVLRPRSLVPMRGPVTTGPHTPVSNEGALINVLAARPSYGSEGAPAAENQMEVMTQQPAAPTESTESATAGSERLLDAWYAEFSNPVTRALLRTQPSDQPVLEVIIGPTDDRVQVGATTDYPWRCICSLLITANDGSNWIGSGWLIGPRTVVTAGHCVYMSQHGGWASSIEVIPGRNGANRPYGSCVSSDLRSVQGWTQDNNTDYDYGVILLPESGALGNQVGWFGFVNYSDDQLKGQPVNIAGYPGDKPAGTQWFHSDKVTEVDERKITYTVDTVGGQSGSPVWMYQDGNRYGVAIHTNGQSSGNSGTRITTDVYQNLVNWKTFNP